MTTSTNHLDLPAIEWLEEFPEIDAVVGIAKKDDIVEIRNSVMLDRRVVTFGDKLCHNMEVDNSELEEFFHILDIYNEYRKDYQDKEPSKYWVINREEVPKIRCV